MSRYCPQCGKANNACICEWIKAIDSPVRVVVLQHPTESKRPMGTAKILQLSLQRCDIWIGEDFSQHEQLNAILNDENVQPLVLYPNEQSRVLNADSKWVFELANAKRSLCVILLDGTWKKAYKMWQLSTNLHTLPSMVLPSDIQGNYRIRKAPTEQHLSTVEAGFHALRLLDSQRDYSSLLSAFTNMVDFQIAQMPQGVFERNYTPISKE